MYAAAEALVFDALARPELQEYFRRTTHMPLTITRNENDMTPPSALVRFAGGVFTPAGSGGTAMFNIMFLLPYFEHDDIGSCLVVADMVTAALGSIKKRTGITQEVQITSLEPPKDGDPAWALTLTVALAF